MKILSRRETNLYCNNFKKLFIQRKSVSFPYRLLQLRSFEFKKKAKYNNNVNKIGG